MLLHSLGTDNATLTVELLTQVLEESQVSKQQKLQWLTKEQASAMVRDATP